MSPKSSPSSGVKRADKQKINDNIITNEYDISMNRQKTVQNNNTHLETKQNIRIPKKRKKKKKKTKRTKRTLRKLMRRDNRRKQMKVRQNTIGNRRIGRHFAIKRQKTKKGMIHTARRPSRRLKDLIYSRKKCKNRHTNPISIFPLLPNSEY